MLYTKRQLRSLLTDQSRRQKLTFRAAGRRFFPGSSIIQGSVHGECPIGMIVDDSNKYCGMFVTGIF